MALGDNNHARGHHLVLSNIWMRFKVNESRKEIWEKCKKIEIVIMEEIWSGNQLTASKNDRIVDGNEVLERGWEWGMEKIEDLISVEIFQSARFPSPAAGNVNVVR